MNFSKEDYDVSRTFLAYLAFLGNTTKVGIALNIPPEVVEVLAAKEDWPNKLKTYMAIRHDEEITDTDRAIGSAVAHIHAVYLREIINRLIKHLCRLADENTLLESFSHQDRKTGKTTFKFRMLFDLVRASNLVSRIILRTSRVKPANRPESEGKSRLTLRKASELTMSALDHVRGIDSVALAKESMAKWGSDPGRTGNGGTTA